MRRRIVEARAAARERAPGRSRNAHLTAADLDRVAALGPEERALLERAAGAFAISARGMLRVRRVARTIADLDGAGPIRPAHLSEALQYRLPA